MIDQKTTVVNKILSTISIDRKDPSVLRLDINNAAKILTTFGFNLPAQPFEKNVEVALNKILAGKAKVSNSVKYAAAEIIVSVANRMHIPEEKIIKYIQENDDEEDIAAMQTQINEWRKTYYGNMDKSEKQALIEVLHDRLRPEILDQIRNS